MYYTIFAKREENFLAKIDVAPLAGAWIEILEIISSCYDISVAPLAGAWIEIVLEISTLAGMESLPSRERGLK